MVAHTEGTPDHLGYALGSPPLVLIAERPGACGQKTRKLSQVFGAQFGRWARCWMAPQCLNAAFAGPSQPVAHRAGRHPEGDCNIFLLPTTRLQFPGALSSRFLPIKACCLMLHVFLIRSFSKVYTDE